MASRPSVFVAATLILVASVGCGGDAALPAPRTASPAGLSPPAAQAKPSPVVFPELGPSRVVEPGVAVHEVTIDRGGVPMKVWVYRPEKPADKLALVLVPPAGSTLIAGMGLADGDRVEHLPYVKAGFAVAAFEIDGPVSDAQQSSDPAVFKGAREFRAARAGLDNAQTALDFALAKVPGIDPARVYVAGHSSAATLALLVAEYEPRVKACVAYAPCTDVAARVAQFTPLLERNQPGYAEFLKFSSPLTHAELLTCPLFLFHAQDDTTVRFRESATFYEQVRKTNPKATLVKASKGGHYDPMIQQGIPKAIAWLKQLPKA